MATGIPDRNGTKRNGVLPFHLTYDGKAPVEEILRTPPAVIQSVGRIPGEGPSRSFILGENLGVLAELLQDEAVAGQVKLVYIDPPYGTNTRFESRRQHHAYDDYMVGASYLEFLRKRLVLLRELLADDGSIYVHLDDNMAFQVKVLMDEIFGPSNFRNWITRKKSNPKNYTRRQFGNVADYILFYSKSSKFVWNQQFTARPKDAADREYRHVEPETGRRYMKVPVHAPGVRRGETGQPWRGRQPPPGKHWQYTPSTLDEMDERGEIVWSPSGNPRRKVYLDSSPGVAMQDIWLEFRDAHNQMIEITGYPTEKNLDMLRLIVRASSNPGDLVLDAFAGSGTTAVAAEELGRRWIAIDNTVLAMRTTLKRLLEGSERMGDYVQTGKRPVQARLRLVPGGVLCHEVQLSASEEALAAEETEAGLAAIRRDF